MINLIAETAFHHEGDFYFFDTLLSTILQKSEAHYVKCHLLLDIEEYMLPSHALFKKLKNWLFTPEQWNELLSKVVTSDKRIMLLFNDSKAVEFGMKFQPELIEIHSVCLSDIRLLDCVKANVSEDTKIVIGVGGSTLTEIDSTINYLKHPNIVLMHGFQNYPTRYKHVNLKKIRKIMRLYPTFCHGYADHTAWNEKNNLEISLLGAACGVDYIEKHVTTELGEKRCDFEAAVSIEMLNELAKSLAILNKCNGSGQISLNQGERTYNGLKKTPLFSRDLPQGTKIEKEHLIFKRTTEGSSIRINDLPFIIGSFLQSDVHENQAVSFSNLKSRDK